MSSKSDRSVDDTVKRVIVWWTWYSLSWSLCALVCDPGFNTKRSVLALKLPEFTIHAVLRFYVGIRIWFYVTTVTTCTFNEIGAATFKFQAKKRLNQPKFAITVDSIRSQKNEMERTQETFQ